MTTPTLHPSRFDAFCSAAVYEATYYTAAAVMTLGWGLRTAGREHIPANGPALLIANHQSFLDPLLVGLGTRRHLCYLARKTLFKGGPFTWLIRMLNAVPIDQEGVGKEGIKTILEQLQRGRAVVVFPEGERTHDGAMQPLKPGIQLLIKRAQAPIIPVGIAGAYDALPRWHQVPTLAPVFWPGCRARIAVAVGPPLDGRRYAELPRQQSLGELYEKIAEQWRKAERLRGVGWLQDALLTTQPPNHPTTHIGSRIQRHPIDDVKPGVR
jgi:1-acyl-sn-glycerol-3-phosphate acyltransferase